MTTLDVIPMINRTEAAVSITPLTELPCALILHHPQHMPMAIHLRPYWILDMPKEHHRHPNNMAAIKDTIATTAMATLTNKPETSIVVRQIKLIMGFSKGNTSPVDNTNKVAIKMADEA